MPCRERLDPAKQLIRIPRTKPPVKNRPGREVILEFHQPSIASDRLVHQILILRVPLDECGDEPAAWHYSQSLTAREIEGSASQSVANSLPFTRVGDFGVGEDYLTAASSVLAYRELAVELDLEAAGALVIDDWCLGGS